MAFTVTITPPKSLVAIPLDELWRYRELFYIFAWRDIKVRYKQTFLGIAWAVFQPLVTMIIFTLFFGRFLGSATGGVAYPVFVYTGLIFWNYFSTALTAASGSLLENEAIIKKVYFPRLVMPIAATAVYLIDFAIAACLLVALLVFYDTPIHWLGIVMAPLLLGLTFLTVVGLGLFLAALNAKYRDVRYILPFFIQMLLFVTPVIYPASIAPSLEGYLAFNPLTGIIETARSALLQGTIDPSLLGKSGLAALIFLAIGLTYFRKTEKVFADVI